MAAAAGSTLLEERTARLQFREIRGRVLEEGRQMEAVEGYPASAEQKRQPVCIELAVADQTTVVLAQFQRLHPGVVERRAVRCTGASARRHDQHPQDQRESRVREDDVAGCSQNGGLLSKRRVVRAGYGGAANQSNQYGEDLVKDAGRAILSPDRGPVCGRRM